VDLESGTKTVKKSGQKEREEQKDDSIFFAGGISF
jgi:hypothetical protein